MRIVLYVVLMLVAVASLLFGMQIMGSAKSAVHEIEALILFLIFTVAMGAVAVGTSVEELLNRGKKQPVPAGAPRPIAPQPPAS